MSTQTLVENLVLGGVALAVLVLLVVILARGEHR